MDDDTDVSGNPPGAPYWTTVKLLVVVQPGIARTSYPLALPVPLSALPFTRMLEPNGVAVASVVVATKNAAAADTGSQVGVDICCFPVSICDNRIILPTLQGVKNQNCDVTVIGSTTS